MDFVKNLKFNKTLDIPKNITFGVEIEFEKANIDKVEDRLCSLKDSNLLNKEWKLKQDDSLYCYGKFSGYGGELISPILKDVDSSYKQIKTACHIVDVNGGIASKRCGAHIHIGSNIFDDKVKYYIRLAKLWTIYEEIILRFSAGENEELREYASLYASSSAQTLKHIDKLENEINIECNFENFAKIFGIDKKMAISFYNLRQGRAIHTLEVRCPNGTINPLIWENNINFFIKLLLSCKDNNKDWEYIESLYNKCKNNIEENYIINIDKATELSEFIFDKEIDKDNFMLQYEKDSSKILKLRR